MAYTQGAFGAPRYESSPFLTRGQIERGSAPARNVFRPPSAGVSPTLAGPSSLSMNANAPTGTFVNMINRSADAYMLSQRRKSRQAQQTQKAQQRQASQPNPYLQGYQSAQRTQQIRQAQQQQAQLAQQNPLTQAWTQSPNNPANMWNAPSGSPINMAPPMSKAPRSGPQPPAGAWTGSVAPPPPPRNPVQPPNSFSLPPLAGSGGDFLMQSLRNAPDIPNESPLTTVQWKDEPVNPLPMGTFKPFDTSRMFDPTYKPNEEKMPTAGSRTQSRPPK